MDMGHVRDTQKYCLKPTYFRKFIVRLSITQACINWEVLRRSLKIRKLLRRKTYCENILSEFKNRESITNVFAK